ncbi:hypothetical protein D3C83_155030 [compost metagenome]
MLAFSPWTLETMYTEPRSLGSSTCGAAVLKMSVYGSVAFASTMGLVKVAKDEGLLGTPGTRFR